MTQANIINHYSLLAFCNKFGSRVAVGTLTNSNDGSEFKATSFTDKEGKRTLVRFGKSLAGGLTLAEIAKRKDELQVVQLEVDAETLAKRAAKQEETGREVQMENYALCVKGENAWEEVELVWD